MNLLLLLRQKLKLTRPRVPRITQAGFIRFTKKSLATYLIVFIAFSGTAGIFLFNPFGTKTAEAAWFNDNWSYRQISTVTVTSSASDITDLQTILTIDTSTLITAGKLQSSCQDLRFTNQSGKILPYYIDSGCNTASTKVWVLADLVPKNTTTYLIYMYYGNPSANAGSGTFPNFNLVQGLVGYWTGNESSWNGTSGEVKDSSVNGNNGTATGGLSTTTGKYGNSGDWDSTDDAISLGSASVFDNLPASGMTVSAWIYPDTLGQSGVGFVTAKNTGAGQNQGWFLLNYTNNTLQFVVDGSTDLVVQTSNNAISLGTWNHVVLSWDGVITTASSVHIYVNGAEVGYQVQTNGANRVDDASSSLYIGNASTSTRTFDGKIDDYRLYNRAFSAAEVVQLYQNPGSITTTATTTSNPSTSFATEEKGPSPVAYWKLDEGQGTTAYDSTANGLNGTLVSGPTVFTEDRCIAGKCYWSDGVGDYFDMGAVDGSNNTKLNITGAMTVSFWYRPNETASSVLVSRAKGTSAVDESFTIQLTSSNYLTFFINPTSGSTKTITSTKTPLQLGQWYHISAVYVPSTSMTLYVNGQVEETSTSSIPSDIETVTGAKLYFAGICSTNCTALSSVPEGAFDELKIYNFAQTDAQVLANYNARENPEGLANQSGNNNQNLTGALADRLVGYWNMDATSGNAADSSGMATTLTNNSSTSYTTGKYGSAGSFVAASTDYFSTATTISGVKTVTFWTYNASSTDEYINLTSGAYITSSSGTLSATGFTSPQIYVNGVLNGTLTTSTWNHVVVTTDTSIDANQFEVGRANSAYNNGRLDEIRLYSRVLSPTDIGQLYTWAPGPVGYWRLDERTGSTTADASGYANNGTLGSTTAAPSWANGKYGSALSYDGGDTVSVSDSTSLSLTRGFSLTAWVNVPNVSGYKSAVTKENAGQTGYFLYVLDDEVYTGYGDGAWRSQTTSTSPITANTWIHIASTFDGTTLTTYVNGAYVQSSTPGGSVSDNASALGIGNASDLSSMYTGLIDEAKVYNYPRTAGQIVADMNAGHPAPGSPVATPIVNLKFNDGYGTTAYNSGSAGTTLNGTLTNMASPGTSTSGWTDKGKYGKGLNFDGSNDFVQISDNDAMDVTNFTVSAWMNYAATGAYKYLTERGTDPNFYLYYDGSQYVYGFNNGTSNVDHTYTTAVSTSRWYHIAMTYDGSYIKLYIDGILVDSEAETGTPNTSGTKNLNIGSDIVTDACCMMNGSIDEFKLYTSALSDAQIKLDMNGSSAQVLGALGNNSTAGTVNAASQEYCIPGSSATCTSPNMRLTFEEGYGTTANDITGNANSGSLSGTPAWDLGKFGKGLAFDASDDIVTVSGLANDFFTGSWTQELWIKTTQTGNKVLTEKGSNNAFIQTNSGQIRAGTVGADVYDTTGTPLVTDGTWHHIAVTYDTSTNLTTTYIDGVVRGTKTAASDAGSSATAFALGSRVGLSAMYQGQMDDVRVYNYARSAAQIAWEYNKGLPLAQYNLDECQGTTLNNSISSSFAGTLTVGGSGSSTTVGTCTTSGAWYNGVTGKRNYSISLDGTDDYVTLANASSFPANNASQTIAAWLYYPTTPGSTATAISLVNTSSSSITALQVRSGNIGIFKWGGTGLASTTQPAQATWNHVVYTYDGTTHSLYLNGRLANTSTTSPNSATPNAAYFGDYTASGGEYWPGQIDDVRIYNYPLTAAQALLIFNDGAARYGPVTGAP
jgi:hypothetical protein